MRIATAVAFLVLLATLASPSTSVMPSVEAASNCEGGSAPEWNTTLQRLALVPHASYGGPFYYEDVYYDCLLYTSPSPRDTPQSRMPSSA